MSDENSRVSSSLGAVVDSLCSAVLGALTRAIDAHAIPASAETMAACVDMYAPRLSRTEQGRDTGFGDINVEGEHDACRRHANMEDTMVSRCYMGV